MPRRFEKKFEFENGYGASVISEPGSYGYGDGLYELGIYDVRTGYLVFDTPITDDVLGWLTWEDVEGILKDIEKLPKRTSAPFDGSTHNRY